MDARRKDLGFIKNSNVCTRTKFQTKLVWLRLINSRSSLTFSAPYVFDDTQESQSFKEQFKLSGNSVVVKPSSGVTENLTEKFSFMDILKRAYS